jgi:hypothetical protein
MRKCSFDIEKENKSLRCIIDGNKWTSDASMQQDAEI